MKKILALTYSLVCILLGSCIHEYPQAADDVSLQVNATLELVLPSDMPVYGEISRSTRSAEELSRRFIVDIYQDGKVIEEKRTATTRAELTDNGSYIIPVSLQLGAQAYTVVVWSDYIQASAEGDEGTFEDLHFDTDNLSHIALTGDYHHDHRRREAFCNTQTLDLTAYGNAADEVQVHQRIALKRPHAKFRLVSTDVDEFTARMQTRGEPGDYRVRVAYEYFFPTAYNVASDIPCGSRAGIGFTAPCSIVADEDGRCELASDFIFAGTDDSYVVLTLEVLDETDTVVSRTKGVQVPYRQGHLTVVTGSFLTTMMRPGISINPDYDGEFNIEIN